MPPAHMRNSLIDHPTDQRILERTAPVVWKFERRQIFTWKVHVSRDRLLAPLCRLDNKSLRRFAVRTASKCGRNLGSEPGWLSNENSIFTNTKIGNYSGSRVTGKPGNHDILPFRVTQSLSRDLLGEALSSLSRFHELECSWRRPRKLRSERDYHRA